MPVLAVLAKVGLRFPSGVELVSSHSTRFSDVQVCGERMAQTAPTSTSGAGLRIRGAALETNAADYTSHEWAYMRR